MLTYTPYIYDMFANIVADVQSQLEVSVHYEHGHPLEIIKTMAGMEKTPAYAAIKYPLIALFQDFDEERGTDAKVEAELSLNLIIAMDSKPSLVASERLSCTFKPILYPIYDQLLKSIFRSGYFYAYSVSDLKHTKTDRMYWGKKGLYGNEGNIFSDCIDAIEISGLQLKIKKQDCI